MTNEAKFKIAIEKAKHRKIVPIAKKHKIKVWMDTRQLINAVTDSLEIHDGKVRINGKWNLQIRGKHMRRLKKKMKIKQVGRYIVRDE